jgi:biotin carboxyl carrier protein
MKGMSVAQGQIDTLADLMQEFRLAEAALRLDGLSVTLRRRRKSAPVVSTTSVEEFDVDERPIELAAVAAAIGTPIASPMTGIYYGAPSPGSPAFVKPGDTVTAGQVIGLIEAMKVFNEIPAPISGTVARIVAESGNVVQLGEAILFLE